MWGVHVASRVMLFMKIRSLYGYPVVWFMDYEKIAVRREAVIGRP